MSCDLLPTERPGPHHQGDIVELLYDGPFSWDLLIVHPPCTHLAVSGARWFKDKQLEQLDALRFIGRLLKAPVHRICLENPVGIISSHFRKPEQIVQPWMFGHDASKTTCLWLKNLPLLTATCVIRRTRYANQTPSGQNKLGPSPDRWKLRSETYQGVAQAMAEQWGRLV